MPRAQPDLFAPAVRPAPEGLSYAADMVTEDEAAALVSEIGRLTLKPFEFQGYLGNRRVVYFGAGYDFSRQQLTDAAPVPAFLLPLREKAAAFAGAAPESFAQAMVTEYAPGAGIGWHRDRPQFGQVVGVSLLSSCALRFRRRTADGAWERVTLRPEPRSAYLLDGPARWAWQHSIPPVQTLRYSVTFRRFPR